ncbi:MAG: protein kinase [Deltaproteobacteria bacterium]|nr:protein kinase [Deltaproteobacteria bacterium]
MTGEAADEAKKKPVAPGRPKGPDPLIGRVISDRFRIVSLIARGGMGKVYKAEQAPLGREIALKILNPNYQGDHDPEFHKRFYLEASICAKLTHPNTVTIFDYGRTDDDVYFIAMELLEGRTLHRALREDKRIPAERALHIARQVCRSLREAHGLGVIHRDLKPANIFLVKHGDERDFVKVLDFGLVKDLDSKGEDLTQTGLFMGSPKYMSPEQIRGENVDGRCDVYALGVILYEMLTGKVPFDRANSVNILMAHVHEAPPSIAEVAPEAGVEPHIEQIVLKAMAKNPDERFESMDAMLVALKRVASQAGLAVSRSGETTLSSEFAISGGSTGAYAVVTGDPLDSESGVSPSMTPSDPFAPPVATEEPLPESPFDDPQKRKMATLAVVGALGLAAVLGAVLALSDSDPEPVATEDPAPTEPAQPDPPASSMGASTMDPSGGTMAADPSEQLVRVTLRSEPSGATVLVGDRTYGPTPAEIEWRGDEADEGREVTFQFQLDGYRDFTVTRTVFGDELSVQVELEEVRRTRRSWVRRPSRPRPSGGGDDTSVSLMGYKAEPY